MDSLKRKVAPLLEQRDEEGGISERATFNSWFKKNVGWVLVAVLLLVTAWQLFMFQSNLQRTKALEEKLIANNLAASQAATAASRPTTVASSPAASSSRIGLSAPSKEIAPIASGKFPGTVEGPAIFEWWDGGANCGLVRIPEGESFTYAKEGTWWRFASDSVLDSRYPTHRAEYFNSHSACEEGRPGIR